MQSKNPLLIILNTIFLVGIILFFNISITKSIHFISARETFVAMGKGLQARRIDDELEVRNSYLRLEAQTQDPADNDPELRKLLEGSSKTAQSRISEVIDHMIKISNLNKN